MKPKQLIILATVLLGITIISPLFEVSDRPKTDLVFFPSGIGEGFFTSNYLHPTTGVLAIAIIPAILSLINIFLCRFRKIQLSVAILSSLGIIMFYITLFAYFNAIAGRTELLYTKISYGIFLPLIALIVTIYAMILIWKSKKETKSTEAIS